MTPRLLALLAVALIPFAGCTWDDRPDGGSPTHTDDTMYQMESDAPGETSVGDPFTTPAEAETVEPLDPSTTEPRALPTPSPDSTQ